MRLKTAILVGAALSLAAVREALLTSATLARERRAAIVVLPLIFGALAEAHLALGERVEALAC